jgi:hypothetical protein
MEEAILRRLYIGEGLSAKQIADRLQVPESKIVYWLRKHKVPKRTVSEAIYRRINPQGDPFDIKPKLSRSEAKLKVAGLVLWATEGSPNFKDGVFASNSNPALIRVFVDFLLKVCQVEENKIRVRVVYYANMNMTMDAVRRFWSDRTTLPDRQIKINTYHAVHDFREASKYGTATVLVGNIKLRAIMALWLEDLFHEVG